LSRAHVFVLFSLAACGDNLDLYDGFTPAEWEVIESLSPLPPPPPDRTNRFADNPAAAPLGLALFFEKRLSGQVLMQYTTEEGGLGTVGEEHKYPCTTCHDPGGAFVDTRSQPRNTSLGPNTRLGRNTVTTTNAVYYKWSGWQGFIDTYWGHSILGIEAASANNGDRLRTSHVLWDYYRDEYNALFDPDLDPALDANAPDAARFPAFGKPKAAMAPDGPYEMMTPEDQQHATLAMVNAGKAMGAYVRLQIRREAPFDRYVAGDRTAISASA
jgi:cytochrome c peroxidase